VNTETAGLLLALLPFIIGSAVVPVQIIMFILLLKSPEQGTIKATLFVAGMTLVRLAQGFLFGFVLTGGDSSVERTGVIKYTLLLVIAVLLLITAYKKWRHDEDPDAPPPKWLTMFDSVSPGKAFGFGALFPLISPKLWVFALSALAVIYETQLGQPNSTIMYVLFILLAQLILLLLLLIRILLPKQASSLLDSLSEWLNRNNRVIVIVVALVFGLLFLYQGITGLLA